jgi:hypothetical protein
MAFYSPKSPHNFYWYHDSGADGRFTLIPWDMDNALWSYDPYMQPRSFGVAPVPNWNVEPANCQSRPVWQLNGDTRIVPPRCDRFLDRLAETHFDQFETIAAELLGGLFSPDALAAKVDHYGALMEPLLADDPSIDFTAWRGRRANFKSFRRCHRRPRRRGHSPSR